jgi:hypothetical protein
VFEFPRQEHRNEDLVESPLDRDDGDQSQDRVRDVPVLKEPLTEMLLLYLTH